MQLKYIALILFIALINFTACSKEGKDEAPESVFETFHPTANDILIATADFRTDPPRETTGRAKVYQGEFYHVLRFEDFSIDNGPKLKVYLSDNDSTLVDFIYIDDLKAASGSFNYTYSVNTDMIKYSHVLVFSDEENTVYCAASL